MRPVGRVRGQRGEEVEFIEIARSSVPQRLALGGVLKQLLSHSPSSEMLGSVALPEELAQDERCPGARVAANTSSVRGIAAARCFALTRASAATSPRSTVSISASRARMRSWSVVPWLLSSPITTDLPCSEITSPFKESTGVGL